MPDSVFGLPVASTSGYKFDPDTPPSNPSPYDDEFDRTGLKSKWSLINIGTATVDVNTTVPHALCLNNLPQGSDALRGVIQSAPLRDWVVTCKCLGVNRFSNYAVYGLFVTGDGSGASRLDVMDRVWNNSWRNEAGYFNNQNAWGGTNLIVGFGYAFWYLRMRWTASTLYKEISEDGSIWYTVWSGSVGYTPTFFGLFGNNVNTGGAMSCAFDWVRLKFL
jgi:hypothetical protein